jgi:hypothetical protein
MVNSTVEFIITSFPHPIISTVQGEPDYHTLHSIRKLLRTNALSIDHLGGGALGHLGIIVSIATYATISPAHPWVNLESPGGAPNDIVGGTAAALLAEHHRWEEAVSIFRTWTTVDQTLKKQIITVFEPMYLEILNNDMVGFANTTARDMLGHLFMEVSLMLTLRTTGKICVKHGTHSNLWSPYSSRFRIALIMQKQG